MTKNKDKGKITLTKKEMLETRLGSRPDQAFLELLRKKGMPTKTGRALILDHDWYSYSRKVDTKTGDHTYYWEKIKKEGK